jgi:D-apionolactonase
MAIVHSDVEPSRAVKLCGTEEPDAPRRPLVAGPLAAELQDGQLRYVTFAGVEVVRGIAFLVRDENWGTYTPKIDALNIQEGADRFTVAYRAICADARQRLVYEARISGSSDGSLTFSAVATPETDVITNRTGFIVLHPAGLAGLPVKVTHVDGREVDAVFPEHISPAQPIFDIRALAHEIAPGFWVTCRMEGDTFEMEDQRNWGDASYKTYVRPLALPWGYTLAKGRRHKQAVRLSFAGRALSGGQRKTGDITVTLGSDLSARIPDIGVGLPPEAAGAALAVVEHLRRLAPHFLVGTIDARDGRGLAELDDCRRVAEAIPAKVIMEIVLADETDAAAALAPIAAAIARAGLQLEAAMISSAADLKSWQPGAVRPERPSVEGICRAARAAFSGVRLGGGMLSYFTELNRKWPKPELVDYISHTTCSIVHAADDRSVMETLETLPAIIASTRAMIGQKPYRIGPSAIASRANPYGSGTAGNRANARVCLTNADPRQRGLFNAAWTLGYIAACARGGLEAVTMGAVTGPFGFIHSRPNDAKHFSPYFDSLDGPSVYPCFHVMAGLARGGGRNVVEAQVSDARRAAALAWREDGKYILWLANLTGEPITLRVSGLPGSDHRVCIIDGATFTQAVMNPGALDALTRPLGGETINLDAYAVARLN